MVQGVSGKAGKSQTRHGFAGTARICILIAKSGNKRPLKFVSAHCEHTHVHMLCPDVHESKSGQSGC